MKKFSLFCLFVLSNAAFADTNPSIENCAKLLPPDGNQYELSLNGLISKERDFKGELAITDNTNKKRSDEEQKKLQPFIECVQHIIK